MPDTSWAPVIRCYGNNNRSAMLRLPMSRPCIENRAADMAMNPYLSAAIHLAAGLDGIANKTDPGEPRNENLYSDGANLELLPRTLLDALRGFAADPLVDQAFGPEMKAIFLKQKTREWERQFYTVAQRQIEDMLTFV
jgi:glutamine synthetase